MIVKRKLQDSRHAVSDISVSCNAKTIQHHNSVRDTERHNLFKFQNTCCPYPKMDNIQSLRLRCLMAEFHVSGERTAREAAEKQILDLQKELQVLKTKHKHEMDEMKADIEALEAERLYTVDLRKRFKESEAQLKELEGVVESHDKLRKELKVKEPLHKVGKDIRRRYLEQALEPVLGTKLKALNHAAIERGNAAAHHGNGEADAALLSLITGETSTGALSAVFKNLYRYEPNSYIQSTKPNIREAIDCQATIRTLKSLNRGNDRPLKERQSVLDNFAIIMEKHQKAKMLDGEQDTATREDLERRLATVKEFTAKIVEYDRRRTAKVDKKLVSGR
jgi:hypothetical protein